eukprot:m.875592 g.875592  ORF g.875592 m.875592 type:complete len:66 (+) comp59810_c0_seq28:842-1039(+)
MHAPTLALPVALSAPVSQEISIVLKNASRVEKTFTFKRTQTLDDIRKGLLALRSPLFDTIPVITT